MTGIKKRCMGVLHKDHRFRIDVTFSNKVTRDALSRQPTLEIHEHPVPVDLPPELVDFLQIVFDLLDKGHPDQIEVGQGKNDSVVTNDRKAIIRIR